MAARRAAWCASIAQPPGGEPCMQEAGRGAAGATVPRAADAHISLRDIIAGRCVYSPQTVHLHSSSSGGPVDA
eukprot:COSAG01_NODE_6903_length_3445_cov_5.935445_2_plen_73_part_00